MKRLINLFFAAIVFAELSLPSVHAADLPEVSARAAVVISADTGEVVCSVNCNEKLPMASTTKIMTTLLCLESGNLYEEFTVDSEAIKVEGSSMGLKEGDIVTKYALCCGMLLPSGNDAANAAAVRLAGSIENFAVMMNDKARELGLSRTWFVTPSGLEGEGHGSSALDMAVLAKEALKNPLFREICSSESIKLEFGNPPYTRWLKNTNKLLSMYAGTYGVKTGFTDEAGRCLVSACERDGKNLICVTLNDRNDWNDHMSMYDYAFSETKNIRLDIPDDIQLDLAGAENDKISVRGEPPEITVLAANPEDFGFKVESSPFVYAPVQAGEELAWLSITYMGREVRKIPLCAEQNADAYVPETPEKSTFEKITGKIKNIFN